MARPSRSASGAPRPRVWRSSRCHVLVSLVLVVMAASMDPCEAARKKKTEKGSAGAWPEITREERELTGVPGEPDVDAVVLNRERTGKIVEKGDDTVNVLRYYERIKVLNERGERYGEVHVPAQKYSRVSNIEARTVKADGTVVPVEADQIFEKVLFQVGDYAVTEWVFSFPAVEPGAILEYRYDRHDNFLYYIDPWYFAGSAYTLRSRVAQAFPVEAGYSIMCARCPEGTERALTKWREGKAKGQQYTAEIRNLPGYRHELMMPPAREVTPRLEFVLQGWRGWYWRSLGRADQLFTDWPSVANYITYYYDEGIKEGQSDLRPVVEGWVQGAADRQGKIKAIVKHVKEDFRYLPYYSSVVGRVRPIKTILSQKTADNEEKAVLLMAALEASGETSSAALVAGKHRGPLNPEFVSPSQFTHTIVAVKQPDGSLQWIDPTVSYAPFGFVPWKDSGAGALLIGDGKAEIVDLPRKIELSMTKYDVNLTPKASGRADLAVEAEYSGEDAIDMREELAPVSESARKSFLQEWLADRRPGAELRSFEIGNLETVDEPLRITMKIEAPGLVTMAEGAMLVRGCVLSCLESNPISSGERQHAFFIDRGWMETETVVMRTPDGMRPARMPPPAAASSPVGKLSLNCVSVDETKVRCTRRFTARRNRLPASVHASVRKMFEQIIQADRTTMAFESVAGGGG